MVLHDTVCLPSIHPPNSDTSPLLAPILMVWSYFFIAHRVCVLWTLLERIVNSIRQFQSQLCTLHTCQVTYQVVESLMAVAWHNNKSCMRSRWRSYPAFLLGPVICEGLPYWFTDGPAVKTAGEEACIQVTEVLCRPVWVRNAHTLPHLLLLLLETGCRYSDWFLHDAICFGKGVVLRSHTWVVCGWWYSLQ